MAQKVIMFGLTDACHIITTQFVATGTSAVVRSFGIVATVTTATIIAGTFIVIYINQNVGHELSYRVTFGRGRGGGQDLCLSKHGNFPTFIIPLKSLPSIPLPTCMSCTVSTLTIIRYNNATCLAKLMRPD